MDRGIRDEISQAQGPETEPPLLASKADAVAQAPDAWAVKAPLRFSNHLVGGKTASQAGFGPDAKPHGDLVAMVAGSAAPQQTNGETADADALATEAYNRYLGKEFSGRSRSNVVALGAALLRLEVALGRERLAYIGGGGGQRPLRTLIERGFVDAFVAYVEMFQPMLHALDGHDFTSFMKHASGSLTQYKTAIPHIASPHRLDPQVLPLLAANFQDRSKKRPLVVVVLSALDFDGSLHGNRALIPLLNQPQNLALAIEAGDRRADVLKTLTQLAAEYGEGNKIQDVVFVGHGGPTGIELAGKAQFDDVAGDTYIDRDPDIRRVGDIRMRQYTESLDFSGYRLETQRNTRFKTEKFIRELLFLFDARWGAPVTPRIVLDASLTNAHSLRSKSSALEDHPNLADVIREYSGSDLDVIAANGRIAPETLQVDASGRPTLRDATDPALTSTNKIDYVRMGMEPEGVLRAVVELGERAWPVVEQRLAQGIGRHMGHGDRWSSDVIHVLLEIAVTRRSFNADVIYQLVGAADQLRLLPKAGERIGPVLAGIDWKLGAKIAIEVYGGLLRRANVSGVLRKHIENHQQALRKQPDLPASPTVEGEYE